MNSSKCHTKFPQRYRADLKKGVLQNKACATKPKGPGMVIQSL